MNPRESPRLRQLRQALENAETYLRKLPFNDLRRGPLSISIVQIERAIDELEGAAA